MEKFGIFNILSALSGLTPKEEPQQPANDQPQPAPEQENVHKQSGIFTPDERANRAIGILERHEQIARKIDRKK